MVALPPWKTWRTSTGNRPRMARMWKKRAGSSVKLSCSAVNAIHGSSGSERMRPVHKARTWCTLGRPTAPATRR